MKSLLRSILVLPFFFIPILLNGATAIQLIENGLAIVQVSGTMTGTGSLIAIDNKIYVLTPSHLIQNTINPEISIKEQYLDAIITESNEIWHFKKNKIPAQTFLAQVIYSNPLDDIALLSLPHLTTNDDSELYDKLLYIAKLNLHLCSSEKKGCFDPNNYKVSIKKIRHSERLSWIYKQNIFNQFLNFANGDPQIEFIDQDEFISGLYSQIIQIPIFGGPGMSGGVLYFNYSFGGMVVKVHYDGYPQAYAIPTDQIYEKLKSLIHLLAKEDINPLQIERHFPIKSFWVSKISDRQNKNYLITSFKNQILSEAISKSPFASGGGSGGSVGSSGGPGGGGSIGSGGDSSTGSDGSNGKTSALIDSEEEKQSKVQACSVNFNSTYYTILGLPTIEHQIPLTNPFLVSSPEFYINNDRICRITLTDGRILQTNLAQYLYYAKNDKIQTTIKRCESLSSTKGTKNINELPLKNLRFYILKNANDCSSSPIYEYQKSLSSILSYQIRIDPEGQNIEVNYKDPQSHLLDKIKLQYRASKSGVNYKYFQSDNDKQRAILFFYDELKESQLQPFSLFIQTKKILIQAQW